MASALLVLPVSQDRLRQALRRFNAGGNLTIAMLGGSVTAGVGANEGYGYVDWAALALNTTLGPRVGVSPLGVFWCRHNEHGIAQATFRKSTYGYLTETVISHNDHHDRFRIHKLTGMMLRDSQHPCVGE